MVARPISRFPVYSNRVAAMDVLRDEVTGALAGIRPGVGEVPLLSTVSGEWVDGSGMDAGHDART